MAAINVSSGFAADDLKLGLMLGDVQYCLVTVVTLLRHGEIMT